jgi:hypothetical protein
LTAHGTKATARAAINTSPEPFSNWAASISEDGLVVFLVWLAAKHPIAATITVAAFLALSIYLLIRLARTAKGLFHRLFSTHTA